MSHNKVVLEQAAQEFVEATANPPYIYQLPVDEGRKVLDDLQASDELKPAADVTDLMIDGGPTGHVDVRIVRPPNTEGATLPVILYIHGAGWVFGSPTSHDRLVRELAAGTGAAVVFPHYDRSPEAKFPTAIEQSWATAQWVVANGAAQHLDPSNMVIAGDSVGGNMTAALTLLAKERDGVTFKGQVLFYPVTNADFDTDSYHQFAEGYYLRREGMLWFFDQYTTDPAERASILVSPLRASLEQLAGLPKALVINGEADVLRDEGEAYAAKLREAGVDVTAVRLAGIVHDFVMLDALRGTRAAGTAIALAIQFIADLLRK